MCVDKDGKIRMDCSSPAAMANLIHIMEGGARYDVASGNDADADRHGIVTPDGGLMNPNHYLAVAIAYLFATRPLWGADVAVGKTLVSSSMIDRVPMKALMYNVWTSQMISPERALAIGAISDIVPAAELADKVAALVKRLVDSPKPAVLAVKEYGVNAQAIDMPKAVHFARSLHALVNSSSQLKRK